MNNSKPEQIVGKVFDKINGMASINTVKRVQPRNTEELAQYATTQLPLCAIKSRIPETQSKISSHQNIKFNHSIDLYFYFLDNVNPDETMLDLQDDIWREFLAEADVAPHFLDGLALTVDLTSDANSRYYPPYGMFRMTLEVTYVQKYPGG